MGGGMRPGNGTDIGTDSDEESGMGRLKAAACVAAPVAVKAAACAETLGSALARERACDGRFRRGKSMVVVPLRRRVRYAETRPRRLVR
jgi:hypothetical protein